MIIFICMIFSSVKISKKILIIISMLSVALHSNDNYSTNVKITRKILILWFGSINQIFDEKLISNS